MAVEMIAIRCMYHRRCSVASHFGSSWVWLHAIALDLVEVDGTSFVVTLVSSPAFLCTLHHILVAFYMAIWEDGL